MAAGILRKLRVRGNPAITGSRLPAARKPLYFPPPVAHFLAG
jgi:hypothetical protein